MRKDLIESLWVEKFVASTNDKNTNELWDDLKSKLLSLRDKFVPIKDTHYTTRWKMGSIPIDKNVQNAIRQKHRSHRKWMATRNFSDAESKRMEYNTARNKVSKLIRQAKRRFEKELASKCKINPKAFWGHVRNKLKTRSGISPLLENVDDKTSMKFKDSEKAEILQKQFSSVFTKEPDGEIPTIDKRCNESICDIYITEDMVQSEINKMNVNKSSGPDNIHARLLKELVNQISAPLAALFNKSMKEGIVPCDWKVACVSPIYKKGSKNIAENYRPVSLTSIICKLMESFVKKSIMKHLQDNNLLSSQQFGFISGRSTTLQLLRYLDNCIEMIVSGSVVDTIYLDFAKAFDKVPHRRLIGKLRSYGISGNVCQWIEHFLNERSQVVSVNGEKSESVPVISGIPQGSVLGPILFIIYINDILENIGSNGLLFADDTKIFKKIKSIKDAIDLQSDIHLLEEWSDKWLLKFNPEKCHILTLGKFENIMHTHRYTTYGKEIEHVFEEKDLGIIIDSNLSFEEHIASKIKKANSIMGLIRRSFNYLDCEMFKKLYVAFVRPHLEYSQVVWAPNLKKYKTMIENVQRRATKLVDGLKTFEYHERLQILGLPTLAFRRARGDMIEMYKHFYVYNVDVIPSTFQPRLRTSRKHQYQLTQRTPKDGIRGIQSNSFYYRCSKIWNNLPANVVNANDINSFKNKLDDHWSNMEIKYFYE